MNQKGFFILPVVILGVLVTMIVADIASKDCYKRNALSARCHGILPGKVTNK